MKNFKQILSAVFVIAIGFSMFLTSCSKDTDLVQQENPSVRPDFATIDNRPQEVIALSQVVFTEPVALTTEKAGGKYALVIGISDYNGTANDLNYCDDDATDWKSYLVSQGYSVNSLIDGQATKANIETAVNNLASLSIAGNEITFVYSGHGSKGNMISSDLFYLNNSWLKTKFANATSTKMFFTFDACQIGAFATALNATGRVVAVASNTSCYSYDGTATMKNGVFTYYQMLGFSTQGYVFAEPDCQYAITGMQSWAKTARVRVAPSFVDSYTGNFDF